MTWINVTTKGKVCQHLGIRDYQNKGESVKYGNHILVDLEWVRGNEKETDTKDEQYLLYRIEITYQKPVLYWYWLIFQNLAIPNQYQ